MVKENSIIPVGRTEEPVYHYEEDLLLKIYGLKTEAYTDIYKKDGSAAGNAGAKREKNQIRLYTKGLKNPEFLLVNSKEPIEITNGTGRITEQGYRIKPEDEKKECIVTYKE